MNTKLLIIFLLDRVKYGLLACHDGETTDCFQVLRSATQLERPADNVVSDDATLSSALNNCESVLSFTYYKT
jgi:hypothetical protein